MNWIAITIVAFVAWNINVFAMFGLDKSAAKRGGRRTSERNLLLSAALLGAAGALLGMYLFRHKTKHVKFVIGVPVLLIANIAAIICVYVNLPVIES